MLGRCRVAPGLVAAACGALLALGACGGRSTLEPGQAAPPSEPPSNIADPPSGMEQPPVQEQPPIAAGGSAPVQPMQPLGPPCESVMLEVDELRPNVTLLVDQSGSMREGYPLDESTDTRWSVVREALLNPQSGVVPSLQESQRFGLVFYTSHNGFYSGTCPILNEVRSATNNYEAIVALYDSMYPDDDTPTGPAILEVVRKIEKATRRGPEVILLVTDGDPDTCEQPDPQDGQQQAIAGAAAAYAAGIDFYVLGISTDISGDKLQQLANAGQGKPLDAVYGVSADAAEPFQAAGSVEGLTTQLRDILARVPLCEVGLDRNVSLDELYDSEIVLDGKPLTFGDPDGFRMKDRRHLEIAGAACERLRAAGKRLSVRISCP